MRWRVTVVQRGRLRDPHVIALRTEYIKRFRRFGELIVAEREPRAGRSLWPPEAGRRVLLDRSGKAMDSRTLATAIQTWSERHGLIAIAIGDAYGHDPTTVAEAQVLWSLGPLTLPHSLAHLVAIEQIYRAATIQAGLPYHHED